METTQILDPNGVLKEPSMSINAKRGHKVTVTERSIGNGYPLDEEKARHYLKVGQDYYVERVEVHDWSSTVTLIGFPGIQFNSVHFIDAK
jgi:hypothetical protein